MSYGFQALNNSGSVTISTQFKPLVFHLRGTVNVTSEYTNRPGYGTVTLTTPVTTPEPPSLFVRYVSGLHPSISVYFTWLGGPGNWTGFRITSAAFGGRVLQNHLLEWVVCKFTNTSPASGYGLQLYDSDSQPIYGTHEKLVKYSKFTKSWSLDASSYGYLSYIASGISIDPEDFVSVASFDRGLVWHVADSNTQYAGLALYRNNQRTLEIQVQLNYPAGRKYPVPTRDGLYFSMPICKFPSGVFTN